MFSISTRSAVALFFCCIINSPATFADAAPWVGVTLDGGPCTGLPTGYGPFDYQQRRAYAHNLELVERFHYTPQMRAFNENAGKKLDAGFDYTLRAWPNHHMALNSIVTYQLMHPNNRKLLLSPVECYFNRAIAFSPKDPTTHLLYAIYLHKIKLYEHAETQYKRSLDIAPGDPQTQYNYALLLVDIERYAEARKIAGNLYSNKYPLPGLKNKLKNAGAW